MNVNQNTICDVCSAESVGSYVCSICGVIQLCTSHVRTYKHRCPEPEPMGETRHQLAQRGDFAVDKAIVGAQGERRYWLCGPDGAQPDGVTLENLRAVWHLIGEVLESES